MRMWNVPVDCLCRKHLLGEHVEMHMFAGTINRGISIQGYLDNGLVDTDKIAERHDELAAEMTRRGYSHRSPLEQPEVETYRTVDAEANIRELLSRCSECFTNNSAKD